MNARKYVTIASFGMTGILAGVLWLYAERLSQMSKRLYDVIEHSPNAVIVCDGDGSMTFVNERTSALTGYSKEELLGKQSDMLVPDEWRDDHHNKILTATRGYEKDSSPLPEVKVDAIVAAVRCKDGKLVKITLTTVAVMGDHGTEYYTWMTPIPEQDLTENLPGEKFKTPTQFNATGI